MSVDVEEWYHNCWVPEYVDPFRRPRLAEELDALLPRTLERFETAGVRATFFVLGEVARRIPDRVREIAAAGHEVACHGDLHLRANDRSPEAFRRDATTAKTKLEDLVGTEVPGFRAPEWSLRSAVNPRFRIVAEIGFRYDSSLAPSPGAGSRDNARGVTRFRWPDGLALLEAPPATWAGALRLPVGGWCGRLASPGLLARAASRAAARGELPLFVVHPWELVDRPCPGLLTGFARFFHEAGRTGFADRVDRLARSLSFSATLSEALADLPGEAAATAPARPAVATAARLSTAGARR